MTQPDVQIEKNSHDRRWSIIFGRIFIALLVVVFIAVTSLNFIHVNKVILRPGTADPVGDLITFHDVKTYPYAGSLRFLTVYETNGKPNVLEYLRARYLDKDAAIFPWEKVNGDFSTEQANRINTALMKQSQGAASSVALEQLGCDIHQSGTGAIIVQVLKKSAADKIGLEEGDVITAIDSHKTKTVDEAVDTIGQYKPGDTITISIERGEHKTKHQLEAKLSENPDKKGSPQLGVVLATRDIQFNLPVDIDFATQDVSGPSAGLAFTLSIIDQLTKGDLLGGKDIAVTGEIELDGTVGDVGGVEQKAVAARKSGAHAMIVPKGEGKNARKKAGSMKVFEVSNISQALKVLHQLGGDKLPQMRACPSKE
jgi:PDZ domain-containing protein